MTSRRNTKLKSAHKSARRVQHETLERRELLAAELDAPQLIAVSANSGEQFDLQGNNVLSTAPNELKFRFGGDLIDDATLAGIQFKRSLGDSSFEPEANGPGFEVVTPGYLGFEDDDGTNIIVARFAETLPDDFYRVELSGVNDPTSQLVAIADVDGDLLNVTGAQQAGVEGVQTIDFEVEVGPRVVSVVPQPVEGTSALNRVQHRDQIHVFFNEDPLSNPGAGPVNSVDHQFSVVNPSYYQLFYTGETVENTDDLVHVPTHVEYDPALNRARLTFADDLTTLLPNDANGDAILAGTYRLRVGRSDALPAAPTVVPAGGGSGDTFGEAISLGGPFDAGTQSVVVTEGLIESTQAVIPDWPGAFDAPGLRDNRRDVQRHRQIDTNVGINIFPYNFARIYGQDPQLNTLENAITEAQRQRFREVLDLYSERLGVEFVETEDQGLQIVTGDIRSIVVSADSGAGSDTPLSIYRINERDQTRGVLVMDAGENWFDGYGVSPDSRLSYFEEAVRGVGELLGIGDLFELPAGVAGGGSSPDEPNSVAFSSQVRQIFPVEPSFLSQSDITIGRAIHRPESNDVDFYSFTMSQPGEVSIETVAERLDGSSLLDTHLHLYRDLGNGEFELVAQNDDFFSEDSFIGVDLEVGDYVVGVSASGNDQYNGSISGSGLGGTSEGRYELRMTYKSSLGQTITDSTGTELDGDADGVAGGDFNFWFRVAPELDVATPDQPKTIFVDKNGSDASAGTLDAPKLTIAAALELANENDLVRILPNGGTDGLIGTQQDNLAYEIGVGGATNAPLRDGAEFIVPKGVSVVIDAGALFKLREAKISVGSETVDEDRSLASLQVYGTPTIVGEGTSGEVFFTSWDDESLGQDTNPLPTTPGPGQWAGIEFRNDFDYSEGRAVWETEGIFLDYVSHANIQYGGGTIDVNQPVVTPIQMNESRPTLIYNTIRSSADAALSADPNSFLETNFNSPQFQRAAMFTSDYDRVGPELSGNRLLNNSINGLFVRVETPAAGELEPMTVSGRFDDRDVVHVLSQVLVLQGQPGGPVLLESRPDVLSVSVVPAAGGSLTANESYSYRVTYVTADGSESLASLPTAAGVVGAGGALQLSSLPTTPPEFVGRRLYRSIPGTENFEFVRQLDRVSTGYTDDGTTRGGVLESEIRPNAGSVTAQPGIFGSLTTGTAYSYRFTYFDDFGGETSASQATTAFIASSSGALDLSGLPVAPTQFQGTRVYRLVPTTGQYELIDELTDGETSFQDVGGNLDRPQRILANDGDNSARLQPRFDARLSIDPGLVVKLQSARIEAAFGADFIAEGVDGDSIIFTSRLDDTFGAGGTFDTNNDSISDNAAPGDWGGLVFRQDASASLDFANVRFAGGSTSISGDFTEFNAIEILQAEARVANSIISDNADGFQAASTRDGIGFNDSSAIFVRGSQPILVGNTIEDNAGAAISINPNSLTPESLLDYGRSTGLLNRYQTDLDNQGPLIAGNRLNTNSVNAIRVRSEVVTTDSVWDDTDIVHVVDGQVVSSTHHYAGALRLKSDSDQSLVVKFDTGAELVGSGRPLDIEDRIGGTVQVLGTPGNPVVLTSIHDCEVGAGFTPEGRPMNDTINSGRCRVADSAFPYVDVIVVMDESASMAFVQEFSEQLIVDLEAGFQAAGIGSAGIGNRYGAVGFGQFGNGVQGRSILVGGGLYGTADQYAAAAATEFVDNGFEEDGYAALDFTLDNYDFRSDAGRIVIFASNEDRDVLDSSVTLASTLTALQVEGVRFQGIVSVDITDDTGSPAIAIDSEQVYLQNGRSFLLEEGGSVAPDSFFGGTINTAAAGTIDDYVSLVDATNGITGDLDIIGFSPDAANAFGEALIFSIVGQVGGTGNPAAAGDWQGVVLDSYVNDRNVSYVLEQETADVASIATNAVASNAEVLGDLAADEFSGDENERLGFIARGTLASVDDVDVYRFTATGGTGVYLDIDETSVGLDTVLELVNVNDEVLATSDNSFSEARDPSLLITDSSLTPGSVQPLFLLGNGNVESPNPLDAGMRVILPGSTSSENTYYVRVRSKGLSSGSYTLNVRLRETQEVAGSTIQLANIRFATDAITVSSAPIHSPLSGTGAESLNFGNVFDPTGNNPQSGDEFIVEAYQNRLSFNTGQVDRLGNLGTSDRGSLVVTGDIGNIGSINPDVRMEDVDVYQVDLFTQQIEPDVFDSENRFVTTTFDIDYADGLGRANTSIAVYNQFGQLVLHSRDSNIADDRGRPLRGVDSANLDAGSAGSLDAYIGPVELPEGTYFVAVSNAAVVPNDIGQFFDPSADNTDIRLYPVDSSRRLVEATFDGPDYFGLNIANGYDADLAAQPNVFPTFGPDNSILPYALDDVRLFVSIGQGLTGNNRSGLISVNPYSGTVERVIGQAANGYADIAIRTDGELFQYSLPPNTGPVNAANTGFYGNRSPVTGAVDDRSNDGVTYIRSNEARDGTEANPDTIFTVNALAFDINNSSVSGGTVRGGALAANSRGFVIGNRGDRGRDLEIPVSLSRNILYGMLSQTGEITSGDGFSTNPNTHRDFVADFPYVPAYGPASPDVELGVVDTGSILRNGGDGGDITGLAVDPDGAGDTDFFAVTENGGIHSFNRFNRVTGSGGSGFTTYNRVIPATFHGLIQQDPDHFGIPEYTGLTLGPQTIENGIYRQVMFVTTDDGWLYAVQLDASGRVTPANVLNNGRSAMQMQFSSGFAGLPGSPVNNVTGLAFSNLEANPWHVTADRFANDGHGIKTSPNFAREDLSIGGGESLYFGFEVNAGLNNGADNVNVQGNTLTRADDDARGEIAPGGVQGTVVSQSIDLEGYSPSDKPTLYFSYFLSSEDNDDFRPGRAQRDSFRVFASADDGEWQLLATNNDFRDILSSDEFDYFDATQIPAQELFDHTDDADSINEQRQWRQARIDLSPLAGNENVKLRFDYSTAGAMVQHFGSLELVGRAGDELVNGSQLQLLDENNNLIVLENLIGTEVDFPAGDRIALGEFLVLQQADGSISLLEFVDTVTGPNQVAIDATMTSDEVAQAVVAAVSSETGAQLLTNGRVRFSTVVAVNVFESAGGASQSLIGSVTPTIFGRDNLTTIEIANGRSLQDGDRILINGPNGLLTYTFVQVPTGQPNEIVFTRASTEDELARALMALLPSELQATYDGVDTISLLQVASSATSISDTPIFSAEDLSVSEGRIEILFPTGADLESTETLTLKHQSGTLIIRLDQIPRGEGLLRPADVANQVRLLLPTTAGAFVTPAGALSVIASSAHLSSDGPALGIGLANTRTITFPDGAGMRSTETITIIDGNGVLTLQFIESALPGPPGTISYELGDSAADIAALVAAELSPNAEFTLDGIGGLFIHGMSNFVIGEPTQLGAGLVPSNITTTASSQRELRLPASSELAAGETLVVRNGATTRTIVFVTELATDPVNPDEMLIDPASPTETAAFNANRVAARLGFANPVFDAPNTDTFRLDADAINYSGFTATSQLAADFDGQSNLLLPLDTALMEIMRNGLEIEITGSNQPVTLIFLERGLPQLPSTGSLTRIPVFFQRDFNAGDPNFPNADAGLRDVFEQIIRGVSPIYPVYVDPFDQGLVFSDPFATVTNFVQPSAFTEALASQAVTAAPLTLPPASELVDGESIRFVYKFSTVPTPGPDFTLTFVANGASQPGVLGYDPGWTSTELAEAVLEALPVELQAVSNGPRTLLLLNAQSIETEGSGTLTPLDDSAIVGFRAANGAAIPVLVNETMTSDEVTDRLRFALNEGLGQFINSVSADTPQTAFAGYSGDRLRLYNVTLVDAGDYGASDYFGTPLPGDEFGVGVPLGYANSQRDVRAASNNENVEGVYIDDIVVGFAERGEMVIDPTPGEFGFRLNPETLPDSHPAAVQPERQNEALFGPYSLEIRTSDEYGVPQDYDPINLELDETAGVGRSFDTNDRLTAGAVSLITGAGLDLQDGDTFVLNDGWRELTFEFDSVRSPGVAAGNVAVPFDPFGQAPELVAQSVRDAINSPQAQNTLNITAATSDGFESATNTGNRVELFGSSEISVNPGGGRFIKLDLVAAETAQGRETSRQIPIVDQDRETITLTQFGDELARSTPSGFIDANRDTVVAVGKIGDAVQTGQGVGNFQDGAVVLPTNPSLDFDSVRIYLDANAEVDIDVDSVGFARGSLALELPVITVLKAGEVLADDLFGLTLNASNQSSLFAPSSAAGEAESGAFLRFRAPEAGYYDVVVSTADLFGAFTGDSGEYSLAIRPVAGTGTVPARDVLMVDYQFGISDTNRVQDQGQLIISSNFITDSAGTGVVAVSNQRGQRLVNENGAISPDQLPLPGTARLLRNLNQDALLPGVVISNNVIAGSGDAAIEFGGDINANNSIASPVPFGRIVNNTIVNDGVGDGVRLSGASSPTVLNNIFSGLNRGIAIEANQFGEVVRGGNAFQSITVNPMASSVASFIIPDDVQLFENPQRRVYIPAAGSVVIDSSFASLSDRDEFLQTVKEPAGISPSPIIAPEFDVYGQRRVDDPTVTTPGGVGSNVFIDRGAVDRADSVRPAAVLTGPQDAVGFQIVGGDQDRDASFVRLTGGPQSFFEVQLVDPSGTGINPLTVTQNTVILTENGVRLTPGADYIFGYSSNSNTIRLTPTAGIWRPDAVYEITLNNKARYEVTLPAGDEFRDGDTLALTRVDGSVVTFEFDAGYVVDILEPTDITMTIDFSNSTFNDGETLVFTSPGGVSRVLEFDNDGVFGVNSIPVNVSTVATEQQLRDSILASLLSFDPADPFQTIARGLGIDVAPIGANQISLSTQPGTVVMSASQAVTSVNALQGNTLTYATGTETFTFEFTQGATSDPDFIPVDFQTTDSREVLAGRLATAIASTSLGLVRVQPLEGGEVLLGGGLQDVATISGGGLQFTGTPGVSTSAVRVPFEPTALFTPGLMVSALQTAIRQNPGTGLVAANPGGSTLLIEGARFGVLVVNGGAQVGGISLPPVSDLAGNRVQETRANDETRFTIIMPEVRFDFGDAPINSSTLLADNGARHTVASVSTLRLGSHLDTEDDGQPVGGDDSLLTVGVAAVGGFFSVGFANGQWTIDAGDTPTNNQTLTVSIDGQTETFELVQASDNPAIGNIPIRFGDSELTEEVVNELLQAMSAAFGSVGTSVLASSSGRSITLEPIDDEDGVIVKEFAKDGVSYLVFTDNPNITGNLADEDVIGFINPSDLSGSTIPIFVTGSGLVDIWIDFAKDGFGDEDKVVFSQPVTERFDANGNALPNLVNVPRSNLPLEAFNGPLDQSNFDVNDKDRWMRVRLSQSGDLSFEGVAVGGEVEDTLISIAPFAPPVPEPDSYTVMEDNVLTVDTSSATPDPLTSNDRNVLPEDQLLPVRYFIGELPQNGQLVDLTEDDELNGSFTYIPNPDFVGTDTFTYRLSTQRNSGVSQTEAEFATVTITVTPVNDPPGVADQMLVATEFQPGESPADQPTVFLASELLAGATGDADIQMPGLPFDESNQDASLRVISLTVGGVTIDASDPNAIGTTTRGGTVSAEFTTDAADPLDPNSFERTYITRVIYQGADYFNSDNLRSPSDPPLLDEFSFTIEDDGLFVDANGDPAVDENGNSFPRIPETGIATARIRVTPQNSTPTPQSELVGIDNADYRLYFTGQGLPFPTPTEDQTLVIPSQFLLDNDLPGAPAAEDENQGINENDGNLRITSVSMDPALGQIVIDPTTGNLLFTPADDIYGQVIFSYEVEDEGVDENIVGDTTERTDQFRRGTVNSTIFVEPVNDEPIAYDRSFSVVEAIEQPGVQTNPATLSFTANDLVLGAGVNPTSPITTTPNSLTMSDGATMIDGETVIFTDSVGRSSVIEFSTDTTPSVGTDVLVTYNVADTADQIAANLQIAMGVANLGGVVNGATVTVPVVTAASTSMFTTMIAASANGISIPDGAMIQSGELIRLFDTLGNETTVELSTTGSSISNADIVVTYTAGESASSIIADIRSQLSDAGIGSVLDGTAAAGRAGILFNSLSLTSINDASSLISVSGATIDLPATGSLIDGETITLTDSDGTVLDIEFNTTGIAGTDTEIVIQYSLADSESDIADRLLAELRSRDYGVTSSMGSLMLTTISSGAASAPVTALSASPDEIQIPDSTQLIDGETVTLTVDGNPVVIEFNTSGVAAAGTDYLVTYSPGDISSALASNLAAILAVDGFGATEDGAVVRISNPNSIVASEIASVPGDFDALLPTPYNEDSQTLRVVEFATSSETFRVPVGFNGEAQLPTDNGLLRLNFTSGIFTFGTYEPNTNYNELPPFDAVDLFTYRIADDGNTTLPGVNLSRTLPAAESIQAATVTITVQPANDKPFIEHLSQVDIAEDPAGGQATIDDVFTKVLPGPDGDQNNDGAGGALDELVTQGRPVVTNIVSTDPDGVMAQAPVVTATGGLTLFPNQDAVGQVIYVFTFTDDHPTNPQSTDVTVTVNVRAVNDAPRFDPNIAGTGAINGADDAYSVARQFNPATGEIVDATITYTLREDNSQPVGSPDQPYFIPFQRDVSIIGYNPVGLLDVFTVGPNNESSLTVEGGGQTLDSSGISLPPRTALGGTLTLGTDSLGRQGVFYDPPQDFNNEIDANQPVDSFEYFVTDDGTTYVGSALAADPQTSSNFVQFVLNPVNDRPQFQVALSPADPNNPGAGLESIETVEDSTVTTINNFAFGIEAGPPATAFDEVRILPSGDVAQPVRFSVTSLGFPESQASQFFSEFPTVSQDGTLNFQPAADVFGSFDFELVLTDDGPGNETRGDLISSLPVTFTIDILPVNDPPSVASGASELRFQILETDTLDIRNNGVGGELGLLDVMVPGPANEGPTNTIPGGNQTIRLNEPTPIRTAFGGTVDQIIENNVLVGLRYTPRANFVGTDSFIYTVVDDGISIDFDTDGLERSDPRIASNTVTIEVGPVNNPPQFSGPSNVTVNEDGGAFAIDNWATNVFPGPPTAQDELATQDVFFTITQTAGDPNLFSSAPIAVVNDTNNTATLEFEPAGDANGVATFEVQLFDIPTDGTTQASSAARTFTLRIDAVNDAPTFDFQQDPVTVGEDTGPYAEGWASNISPGPSDESDQSVQFAVSVPTDATDLFQSQPEIADDGTLRFIPAANANGTVDLTVTAIDSGGAVSDPVTLRLIITAENDRPVAVADQVSTTEDAVLTILSSQLLANDMDPDIGNPADTLTLQLAAESVSLSGALVAYNSATGQITYDPTSAVPLQSLSGGQSATDSFTYSLIDSAGLASNIVTVSVDVTGINDAPVAIFDNPTLNPDGPTVIEILANDSDVDGDLDPTTIEITLQPAFGAPSIQPDGTIIYTPFQSFTEEDQFRYRVADNDGAFSGEVLVTISSNAAPIARDDLAGAFIDEFVDVNVILNDEDPNAAVGAPNNGLDLSSIQITSAAGSGTAVPQGDGTIRYIPIDGFVGTDSFQYSIADTEGRFSSPATVQVRVVSSRLQNPDLNPDVNDDGDISPIDALLVINRLARDGSGSVPVTDQDSGAPFYDVDGNQVITPLDALRVINALELRNSASAEGEQIVSAQLNQPVGSSLQSETEDAIDNALTSSLSTAPVTTAPPVDEASAVIDLIAAESDDSDDEDDEQRLGALDAAFGDLI